MNKIRIKTGDKVIVRSGKYKGQTGKVLRVHPKTNQLTVEGINIVKKHIKRTEANPTGSIKEIVKPIDVSKVGIYDAEKKKASRIGYKINTDGTKSRFFKSSGKEIK